MKKCLIKIIGFALVYALVVSQLNAATITIVTSDGINEGFNDLTPFNPTGGNSATTLGQARLNALKYAASILEKTLPYSAAITIRASMDPLGGSSNSATLASAGSSNMVFNFDNAPKPDTLYPIALANYLFGQDISPETPDIVAIINSDIDSTNILQNSRWYYGLDATPPNNHPDFVTVLTHELMHGLGFTNNVNLTTGEKSFLKNDIYAEQLSIENNIMQIEYPDATDSQRAESHRAINTLLWNGQRTNSAALMRLSSGLKNAKVKMYTPSQLTATSSVSHFDTELFPNEPMEPFYTGPNHSLGIAAHALSDMGWGNLADLSIHSERAIETESNDSQHNYRITVANSNYDSAGEVMITLPLSDRINVEGYQSEYGGCTIVVNKYTCQLGSIHTGGQKTIYLALSPSSLETINLYFSVSSNSVDPNISNNIATDMLQGRLTANPSLLTTDTSSNTGAGGKIDLILLLLLTGVIVFRTSKTNKV